MATKLTLARRWRRLAVMTPIALLLLAALLTTPHSTVAAVTPSVSIAQYPLTVAVPAHPQVLFAVGNSQSMDGDLSGAIMTGSGGLGTAYAALNASSSPADYTVPADFTAPLTGTTAGNSAPYTVTSGGVQYDNSASRLNVAKAGITSILQNFLSNADFGLIDYQTTAPSEGATWVYYMSQPGGFTFTNTADANTVANPCYGVTLLMDPSVYPACGTLSGHYDRNITYYQYMETLTTSDDPSISDVLYNAPDLPPVFITFGGPNPASPFGPPYSLASYNDGGVEECYGNSLPSVGGICETPTNAGYVPYSTEVMNVMRGFGYWTPGGQTHVPASMTSWAPLVPMTSAGQVPTTATVSAAEAVFSPYLQPETNHTGTSEIKALATQSPIAGLLQAAGDYYSAKNPASTNGCTPNRYVVLVTDGLPTLDLAGHNWPPLGSASASGYGVIAGFNGDGSLNMDSSVTNDQALIDTVNTLTTLKNLTPSEGGPVKTYIIALGAGVNPATIAGQTMTAMAIAGGTNTYFSAQNVAQLDQAMQVILAQILQETAATASSSVNSTGINTTSVAYQGRFTTSDTYQDWTGDLVAYPINATTGDIDTADSAEKWSAQALLDVDPPANRQIATWDPVAGKGIPFEWNSSTTAVNGIASSTAMGQALMTFAPDTNGQDVLNYLRGTTTLEKRNGVGQFRNRSHILGDIVDSSPLYIGAPSGPWQEGSYFSFQAMYAGREPLVYIGADDGMLHAFDANTGQEKFAFIPEGVYGNLVNLVNPYYNAQHRFYVDGSPTAADVQFADGNWHTVLFGSERAGGSTIFALDVTDPSQFTSETAVGQAVLWEFTDPDMGLSFSTPVAVNTAAGFVAAFGNGYDSPNNKPVLYALNPQTGATMAKIDLCAAVAATVPTACNGALPNGLSNVVAMNTTGAFLSGTSNVLYAGDLQGNLWRVDITNSNPSLWTVSVLFQARDPSGTAQPITVTPAVTLNPLIPSLTGSMVYFATGELLGIPDLSSTQVQSVYGIFDSGAAPAAPLTRGDLQAQVMSSQNVTTTEGVMTTIRLLTSNAVNLPVKHGWFVDLNLVAGERVVTDPALVNGTLQLTSYQPNSSTCMGGGNGWYMVFDYATGGATDASQFGWNSSDSISSADLYMGQVVSGVSEGAVYAAGPKMVTGAGGAVVYTTSGGSEITSGANAGECTSISGTTTSCIPKWQNADSVSHGAWQEIR